MNDKQQLMALGEEMAERCQTGLERAQFDSGYLPEAEHAATQRQRDELLAALEALVEIIADTPRPDPDDVSATIDEARSVINKVRSRR